MEYRRFGRLAWDISLLGFGCMRLPTTDGMPVSENIDETEAIRMIRHALDRGVNYADTAYSYHGGRSEAVLGKAIKGEYRDVVKVATKSPVWLINQAGDFDRYLDQQLERLGLGYVNFYLLHGLNRRNWKKVTELGLLERAEAAVRDGRVMYVGFSFHDRLDVFKEIVDGYDGWDLAQIQYNYMDTESQAGTEGLKYAAAKGIPVVVMEPLLGGCLARPPQAVREIFDAAGTGRTPAGLALQWLWDQPEVNLVLSGMSTMPQLEENLDSADASGANPLTAEERELISRMRSKLQERMAVGCTGCGYCLPCPNGVNIPGVFDLLNYGVMYDGMRSSRFRYERFFPSDERAGACNQCGECEEKCPQSIAVSEWMPRAHAVLTGAADL